MTKHTNHKPKMPVAMPKGHKSPPGHDKAMRDMMGKKPKARNTGWR